MIFDGFDNDEDLFRALPSKAGPPTVDVDISLDDLILQREEREANRDFSHYYDTYQIEVARPPKKTPLEDKENVPRNSSKSPKLRLRKGRKCGGEAGGGREGELGRRADLRPEGSQVMLDLACASQPSLLLDFKPSLVFLNADQSNEGTPRRRKSPRPLEPCESPLRVLLSPHHGPPSFCQLGRRESLHQSGQGSPLDLRPAQKRPKARVPQAPVKAVCCKLIIKDPRRSMQDVPCPNHKRNPNYRRSFSVNSIAREIFKAAAPQNHSFQSILSMDFIGTSHIELEDAGPERCGACQKEFRVRDVVAKTHACQHSFHKGCLDDRLYSTVQGGVPPSCPTCLRHI